MACRSLCSRIARPRKGLDRRAHVESGQATPPLRGWKEKEQSVRSTGAVWNHSAHDASPRSYNVAMPIRIVRQSGVVDIIDKSLSRQEIRR